MKIVLQILNFNSTDLTIRLVSELNKQIEILNCRDCIKLLVVDNSSSDNEKTKLDLIKNIENLELLLLERNYGYGLGNNYGFRYIEQGDFRDYDYVLVLNPDVIISNNLVEQILLVGNENFDFIGLPIINGDQKFITYKIGVSLWALRPIYLREDSNETFFYLAGSALGISKNIINLTDGFSEELFLYFEEIELFRRVVDVLGHNPSVIFLKQVKIKHEVGGTMNKLKNSYSPTTLFYSSRNRIYISRKLGFNYLVTSILHNIFYSLYMLIRGGIKPFNIIAKATFWGLLK